MAKNKEQPVLDKNAKKEQKQKIKDAKFLRKIARIDEKWMDKYGVTYTDAILKDRKRKKGKNPLHDTFAVLKYVSTKNKLLFIPIILLLIATAVLSFFVPFFIEKFIACLTDAEYNLAITIGLTLCVILLVNQALSYYQNYLSHKTNSIIGKNLKTSLLTKVINTKQEKFSQVGSGQIMNKALYSPDYFTSWIIYCLQSLARTFTKLGVISYITILDYRLALPLLIGATLVFICEILDNFLVTLKYDKLLQKINDNVADDFSEVVRGSADVKTLNSNKSFIDKINKNLEISKKTTIFNDKQFMWFTGHIPNVLWTISFAVFVFLCVNLLMNGQVALSVVLLAVMYRNSFNELFYTLEETVRYCSRCEMFASRIYSIINEDEFPTETFGSKHLKNVQGNLEFKNVTFKYNDGKENVLDNLSFTIPAGKKVAFVGESGGGKSTIIKLIPKLLDVTDGAILLDNVNINELDKDSIRNNIGLVSQTPYIFNGTIKENLLLANDTASEKELWDALKKAQLYDFIKSKPDGLNTIIGEGGIKLSGGQRQRLAIARELLRKSKILLLDEATSALDNQTQDEIKQTIDNISGQTIIIVAHRLSTIIDCDTIMLLKDGKIVASGTHSELMQHSTDYKKLYKTEDSIKK